MKKYTVAVVGATGLVGQTMLEVLEERKFPVKKLLLLASERSAGKEISWKRKTYTVEKLTEDSFKGVDIALFSAGGSISKQFAPIAAGAGCVVIDNSSAWRMHPKAPLVVPEVNPNAMKKHYGIIANPNCSTIQLVVALQPIHKKFGLRRVVVSTYQSISGAGQKGVDQLFREIDGHYNNSPFPYPIAFNTMFHSFSAGEVSTEEEVKMIKETRRIMSLPELRIAVTCVRVPTLGGHAESVNLETEKAITPEEVRDILEDSEGLIVADLPEKNIYPSPMISDGMDEVFVGRIRKDDSTDNGVYLWIVADNIRKGAATNAVQIAEKLIEKEWLHFAPLKKW